MTPIAWLVPHCPDFYFMPSLFYHQLFGEWDDGSKSCPAYWKSRGIAPIPCYEAKDEAEAQCWISRRHGKWDKECYIKQSGAYYGLWTEALNATRRAADEVYLLRFDLSCPLG